MLTGLTLLAAVPAASAATFAVTKTADTYDGACDADCSLRDAIDAANNATGADTIVVPAGAYARAIAAQYTVTESVAIRGAGARSTSISASDGTTTATTRVFEIDSGDVVISGVTIRDGRALGDDGGGIRNWATLRLEGVALLANRATTQSSAGGHGGGLDNEGSVVIDGATVADNRASSDGGGIASFDTLTATNLTVSDNQASVDGGGLAITGTASVTNASIVSNTAGYTVGPGYGGGLSGDAGTTLRNTLLSGNSAIHDGSVLSENCAGSSAPTSAGHNIDTGTTCALAGPGDQPNTAVVTRSLRDNGGQLDTHSIYPDGAAFDHGDACPPTDARDVSRPQGAACDVGAFELEVADLVVAASAAQSAVAAGGQAGFTVTVRNAGTGAADTAEAHIGISASAGYVVTTDTGSCILGTCTLGILAPGRTATLTVAAQAGQLGPGSPALQMLLQASAHTRTFEQNTADNGAMATTMVNPPPPPPPVSSVRLSLSAAPRQRLARRSLSASVTCDTACTPRANVDLLGRDGKIIRLGSVAGKPVDARVTQRLRLRLSKRAIASLRKALRNRRWVSVRFVIRASTTAPYRLPGGATRTIKVVR